MDIQFDLAWVFVFLSTKNAYTGLWGGVISSAPSPDPGSPLVLFSFFHFIRLFWNLVDKRGENCN
jgi:hypothetical protein